MVVLVVVVVVVVVMVMVMVAVVMVVIVMVVGRVCRILSSASQIAFSHRESQDADAVPGARHTFLQHCEHAVALREGHRHEVVEVVTDLRRAELVGG
jgi:flagellar basal body-associated protein FliL